MADDAKQETLTDSIKLMDAILKKLDCLEVLESRLTDLDRQQRVQHATLQRLEQQRELNPWVKGVFTSWTSPSSTAPAIRCPSSPSVSTTSRAAQHGRRKGVV